MREIPIAPALSRKKRQLRLQIRRGSSPHTHTAKTGLAKQRVRDRETHSHAYLYIYTNSRHTAHYFPNPPYTRTVSHTHTHAHCWKSPVLRKLSAKRNTVLISLKKKERNRDSRISLFSIFFSHIFCVERPPIGNHIIMEGVLLERFSSSLSFAPAPTLFSRCSEREK